MHGAGSMMNIAVNSSSSHVETENLVRKFLNISRVAYSKIVRFSLLLLVWYCK